eukprot:scaffold3522_cov37-Cyclotella_meneghiniana.AAC.3
MSHDLQHSSISGDSIFGSVAVGIRSQASYQIDRERAVEQMSNWTHVQRSTTGRDMERRRGFQEYAVSRQPEVRSEKRNWGQLELNEPDN